MLSDNDTVLSCQYCLAQTQNYFGRVSFEIKQTGKICVGYVLQLGDSERSCFRTFHSIKKSECVNLH